MSSMKAFVFQNILLPLLEPSMRSPSGISGWVARSLMKSANPPSTQAGIRRLDLQPTDVFVELGAGSGAGLRVLSETNMPAQTYLVEISLDFRTELEAVRAELGLSEVEIRGDDCRDMSAFLENDSVDKMFAMNVVYFLNPLSDYLKELYRVLKPGGTLVFGCKFAVLPQNSDVFVNVQPDPILEAMNEIGFETSSEFVQVSEEQPSQNYMEIKGVKM